MFAHKYFRRKVSEHPDFLIKVKNLYIPVTEEGDILKLLPFQGDRRADMVTQGVALG